MSSCVFVSSQGNSTAVPYSSMPWTLDNTLMSINVRSQVVQACNEEKAHLQVSDVARRDAGLYEARVQNELGHETSTFSVNVLGNKKHFSYSCCVTRVCLFRT